MAKEEIVAGLENAVARGESIEKAMQSMISAGYNEQEVKEASGQVNMGSIGRVKLPENSSQEQPEQAEGQEQTEQPAQYKKLPSAPLSYSTESEKPKKKSNKLIIILSILLFFIIVGIGLLVIFGESILSALFPPAA